MNDNTEFASVDAMRREAERRVARAPESLTAMSPEEIQQTVHELQVHQIELEMQNDNLRAMHAQLDESRARYYDLYDLAPVGYISVSKKGLILESNLTAATLLSVPRSGLKKLPISQFISKDDQDIYYRYRKQLLETSATQQCELRMLRSDGELFWAQLDATTAQDDDGAPFCRLVLIDITERKLMKERLHQAEKMDSIGQLAGGVAHDFNNQLGGIMNYADLLLGNTKDEKLHQYIGAIIRSCTRGKDLTGQLLAFSRKGKYAVVPVNIHETIGEVISILKHSIDKRIAIRQLLEANPPTTTGDPTQLQNALLNLALNARDAMPNGGALVFTTGTVTLDEEHCNKSTLNIAPGDYLKVTVADSGTGMDEATRARVFEPFFTTKDQGKGTGMGLASVYGTAINHHGAIEVDSEVGQGTTFTVYLPLSEQEAQESQAKVRAVAAKRSGARVLLVDDEKTVRTGTGELLRNRGYKVVTAENGVEAVEYYGKSWQHIDLVILDMNMPVMNGRDTLIAMREMNPEVKAILATGYSLDANAQEILDEGALSYIQKPYRVDDLVQQIEQALNTIGA
ncbi:MAG: response regulator [Verrucomicrobia bacterium]|nr:response regulator [Verrucomicrobiota bacterium]